VSNNFLRIVTVVGARPQFIKSAAVSRVIRMRKDVQEVLVHTGQHFDQNMSDIFFEELGIGRPEYSLGIGGGRHGEMTGRMLAAIEDVLVSERPDVVLIYGDTNSTLAGALAASKLQIPIAHVEAGLRSFNRAMPEEINRVLSDHISDLLLCPTRQAVTNLEAEGISRGVMSVGDVMYDATLYARNQAKTRSGILSKLGLKRGEFSLCTLHRAENTDDQDHFLSILRFIETRSQEQLIVFPVHPRTRSILDRLGLQFERIITIDPVGYFDFNQLLDGCSLVLTDSGGLQKEAYFHRKPCITLRDETEWVETIEAGWNRLWQSKESPAHRQDISDYGEGDAAEKVVNALVEHYVN